MDHLAKRLLALPRPPAVDAEFFTSTDLTRVLEEVRIWSDNLFKQLSEDSKTKLKGKEFDNFSVELGLVRSTPLLSQMNTLNGLEGFRYQWDRILYVLEIRGELAEDLEKTIVDLLIKMRDVFDYVQKPPAELRASKIAEAKKIPKGYLFRLGLS